MTQRLAIGLWLVAFLAVAGLVLGSDRAGAANTAPVVAVGPVESITEGAVTLTGKIYPEGSDVTACYFEYGPTSAYGDRANCTALPTAAEAAAAVAAPVAGLAPGTTYHYRLVARNALETGVTGDSTFRTAGAGAGGGEKPGGQDPQPSGPALPGSPGPAGALSPPPTTGSGCPVVKLIGVRGSGETDGLGRPIGALRWALYAELGWRVAVSSVDYPARIWPWRYEGSVKDGVKDLKRQIASDRCVSETRYILAGYSQGAQVIGDAIEEHKLGWYRPRILATVFFGDPKFDARLRDASFFGSFRASKQGIFGGRDRAVFVGYNLLSFCRRTDPFCQSDRGAVLRKEYAGHEHYQDSEAREAARRVASAWRASRGR